ncbi:MAG TPA: NDP-sugar synthase [Mycobacteriales bacterium]|nr:NDP-sugar synthase [Mycobacteriales bacterium]
MEAIVLVGGLGTRLRPLTLDTPKPMLSVAGVPFLTHQLARLAAVGVDHVVLATSYRAEVFEEHFGDGSTLGLRLDYVTETEPLGTGGGIRNVAGMLTSGSAEPVIVLNGDVLSGHDIAAQLSLHRNAGAAVTLHLVRVDDPRAFGSVPTDEAGRVTAFVEKSPEPVSDQINAGCYVFRRSVIDTIPAGEVVSVERVTFPQLLAADEVVLGYVDNSYWLDMGTPAAIVQASADLVRGVAPSPAVAAPAEALVAASADVHGSAVVHGGSTVADGATVGAGAVVDTSIVLTGARIDDGAEIIRSVIGADAVVGDGCRLVDVVVGAGAHLGARNELVCGARVWPGVTLPDVGVRFSTDA